MQCNVNWNILYKMYKVVYLGGSLVDYQSLFNILPEGLSEMLYQSSWSSIQHSTDNAVQKCSS